MMNLKTPEHFASAAVVLLTALAGPAPAEDTELTGAPALAGVTALTRCEASWRSDPGDSFFNDPDGQHSGSGAAPKAKRNRSVSLSCSQCRSPNAPLPRWAQRKWRAR